MLSTTKSFPLLLVFISLTYPYCVVAFKSFISHKGINTGSGVDSVEFHFARERGTDCKSARSGLKSREICEVKV